MFSAIASIFATKKAREAEALAKLKEEREARRKRADEFYRTNSTNTIDTTTMSAAYCMSQYTPSESSSRSCYSSGDSYSSSDSSNSSGDSSSSCSSSD
jgi:hypothetical protein